MTATRNRSPGKLRSITHSVNIIITRTTAMGTISVRQFLRAENRIMDKVFRSRLRLTNPHFPERKRGCAEIAAQHSAVQAGAGHRESGA
jgi:hypothetical protein